MQQGQFWKEFIFWSKVAGASTVFLGIAYGIVRWLAATYKKVSSIGENVVLISTNHLPHLSATLEEHSKALAGMRGDVRDIDTKLTGYSTRLDDTKSAIDTLSGAFMQHLQNAPLEVTRTLKVIKKKRV